LFSRFLSRERLAELIKFGAVGGIAFLVNNAVFLLVNGPLGWGPTVAKILSVAIATVVSYFGSRYWTFAKRKTDDIQHEGLAFVVVNLVGLGIEWVPLGISHYLLGFQTGWADWLSGVIIGTALGTIFRYLAYRKWVFTGSANPA